ncbi:MAG: tetratricopeptide repeat protein [Ardenticatenia bacterium]|nr:tetratricopeptide repeat protein [Ardenticatenia bacterium]
MREEPFAQQLARARALAERASLLGDPSVLEVLRETRRAAPTSRDEAQVLLVEAHWLARAGREAEAQVALDTAQGVAAGEADIMADVAALRAHLLARRGKLLAAHEHAHQALQFNPAHVEARLVLAHVAFRLNEPRRAVALYREVIPLLPAEERPAAHLALAEGYRRMGLPALARLHARAALVGNLSLAQRWQAIFLRLTSVHRPVGAALLLAVVAWLVAAWLGSVTWPTALFVALGAVGTTLAVVWLNTPAPSSNEEEPAAGRRAHLPPH